MSDEKKETKSLTGRTAWDFAAEVTQRLGLPILILIGIAYGFYKYQEQNLKFEDARKKANESVQSQLSTAQKQLVDTAVAVGTLNTDIINNITGGLSQLDEIQKRLEGLEEQAAAEAKKAADAVALQKEAEEATIRAKNDFENFKLDKETEQKLRIAKSGPFRDAVKSLTSLLLSEKPVYDPNIKNLAKKIRQDYLVDPLVLFQAVVKEPNAKNLEELRELEGLKYDAIVNILKENKAGFATWILVNEKGEEHASYLMGVVRASEKRFLGMVFFDIDDEGRIWSVDSLTNFFLLVHPNLFDWDNYVTTAIIDHSSGKMEQENVDEIPSSWPQGRMKLSDLIPWFVGVRGKGVEYQVLVGEDLKIMPFTLDEFRTDEPVIYSRLLERARTPVEEVGIMLRTSKTFNATTVVPVSLERGHGNLGNLRTTIIRILEAGVRRDAKERKNLAGDRFVGLDWGMISATALHEQFRVNELVVSFDRLEVFVACSFQHFLMDEILTTGMSLKREKADPQSKWQVTGFRRPSGGQQLQQAL